MARCRLDVKHPKFLKSIGGEPGSALQLGLDELVKKLLRDHKLSNWFNHPMAPHSTQVIWKWDFAPEGAHSSTRKSWRLYAHVSDPQAPEPIPATAFLLHPRGETPKGNPAKWVADALKQFLSSTVEIDSEEDKFKRSTDADGKIRSICYVCFDSVAVSYALADIEVAESTHECPDPVPDSN